MFEIKDTDINTNSRQEGASESFDPDKRVDSKNEDVKWIPYSEKDGNTNFNPDERLEDVFNAGEEYLCNHIPKEGPRGSWDGKPGDSTYVPNENYEGGPPSGKDAKDALEAKGKKGIDYTNGEPDFSEVAEATVEIDEMSENRDSNFAQADQALADKWNAENHGGRNDWTAREIKEFRKANGLTWHERQDCKTMDLVDHNIHGYFTHSGGVSVCKGRNNSGVKFDE